MSDSNNIQPNLLDRAISWLNPKAGAQRFKYRAAQQLLQQQVRRYDAAGHGRRTSGWYAPSTSAQSEVQNALTYLRNRSREMCRNNAYAENAVKEIANNTIGTGIIPKAVDLPKTINKRIKTIWANWADGTECDYDGHTNLYGIQHLAVRTLAESGECIIRKHIMPGAEIPLQLQVLEGDYIDTTKFSIVPDKDGNYILYGIEFNSKHKVVAYWLFDTHPGDSINFNNNIISHRIPAEEIIYLFEKKRPGQFRGVPFGHAAMLRLKDLDEYEDAQLIRQKIAACFSVFVTDTDASGTVGGKTASTEQIEKVEPGIIEYLPPGKQVTMANPPDAGANYDPYVKTVLRSAAVGYGMDYVTLTGDYTAVNYSSGRMGWLKFQRNIDVLQWNWIIPQMCNKMWAWFIQVSNVMGYIRQDVVPVRWTPPRRQMIDPVKETEGLEKAVRAGFTSRTEAIRQNGDDPDEVLEELKAEAKQMDDAGLMLTTDARYDASRKNQNSDGTTPPAPKESSTKKP